MAHIKKVLGILIAIVGFASSIIGVVSLFWFTIPAVVISLVVIVGLFAISIFIFSVIVVIDIYNLVKLKMTLSQDISVDSDDVDMIFKMKKIHANKIKTKIIKISIENNDNYYTVTSNFTYDSKKPKVDSIFLLGLHKNLLPGAYTNYHYLYEDENKKIVKEMTLIREKNNKKPLVLFEIMLSDKCAICEIEVSASSTKDCKVKKLEFDLKELKQRSSEPLTLINKTGTMIEITDMLNLEQRVYILVLAD